MPFKCPPKPWSAKRPCKIPCYLTANWYAPKGRTASPQITRNFIPRLLSPVPSRFPWLPVLFPPNFLMFSSRAHCWHIQKVSQNPTNGPLVKNQTLQCFKRFIFASRSKEIALWLSLFDNDMKHGSFPPNSTPFRSIYAVQNNVCCSPIIFEQTPWIWCHLVVYNRSELTINCVNWLVEIRVSYCLHPSCDVTAAIATCTESKTSGY